MTSGDYGCCPKLQSQFSSILIEFYRDEFSVNILLYEQKPSFMYELYINMSGREML